MSIPVHRQGDSRSRGATTKVTGQGNVFVNDRLGSVQGDPNTHGAGALSASNNDGTVFINNKKVVLKGSSAAIDNHRNFFGFRDHPNPKATGASGDVFACGG